MSMPALSTKRWTAAEVRDLMEREETRHRALEAGIRDRGNLHGVDRMAPATAEVPLVIDHQEFVNNILGERTR